MLKRILKTIFLSALLALMVIPGSLVLAADPGLTGTPTPPGATPSTGLPGATGRLNAVGDSVFGAGKAQPIEKVVGGVIQTGLTLIGVIFLLLTVYGGFIWMTARGEEAEAKRAKGIITMAVIGLVIVVAAYAITAFVVSRLTAASGLSV